MHIIETVCEETHYRCKIEGNFRAVDIWVGDETDLGKGYGAEMMNPAIESCFTDSNVHTMWIEQLESNIVVIRFNERLGFEFVEQRMLVRMNVQFSNLIEDRNIRI